MKPVSYWEAKKAETEARLGRATRQLAVHLFGYRVRTRRVRRLHRMGVFKLAPERMRERHRKHETQVAALRQKIRMYTRHIAYFNERMNAIKGRSRYDRALREPPV